MVSVLHVAPHFHPAVEYGGPIFSNLAICEGIAADERFTLRVLTTDAESPNHGRSLRLERNPDWLAPGFEVHYAARTAMQSVSRELLTKLIPLARRADLIYLTWTYSFPTLPTLAVARWFGKPLVWTPHGAIQATEEWAEVPRRRAKTGFETLCRAMMPRDTVLRLTSEAERRATLRRLPGRSAVVVPNGVAVPDAPPARDWRPGGRLRLLYLGRLHEKKGLEMLLEVMARLPRYVTLDVYGVGERSYTAALRERTTSLGLDSRVRFRGHCGGAEKDAAFHEADLFVLPTKSENFGVAVAEALASGLPVVTTRAAPWEGLEHHGCGLWIEQSPDALQAAIESLEGADLAAMGRSGHRWMLAEFSEQAVNERMRNLLLSVVEKSGAAAGDKALRAPQ